MEELVSLIPNGHHYKETALIETANNFRKINFIMAIKRTSFNLFQLKEFFSSDKKLLNDFMNIERNLLRKGPISEVSLNILDNYQNSLVYLFNDYIAVARISETDKIENFSKVIELQGATICDEKDLSCTSF